MNINEDLKEFKRLEDEVEGQYIQEYDYMNL